MMIEHSIPPLRDPGFTAEAEQSGRSMILRLTGNADMSVIRSLGEFLRAFQAAALKEKVTEVRVEMRDLYFMNSSCLRHFVTWLSATSERPSDQQYRFVFLSNPNLRWQARSLEALKHFAEGLVVIA
jgi:hypothetical protein